MVDTTQVGAAESMRFWISSEGNANRICLWIGWGEGYERKRGVNDIVNIHW